MNELAHYSRQSISEEDIGAVSEVMRSDFLTTGPTVPLFEEALKNYLGARNVVAVSSGTAALHLTILAAGVGPGDEVIVPALTFVATANVVLAVGATPVFADCTDPHDGWISTLIPALNPHLVTDKTKAVMSVDFAGDHVWSDSGYRWPEIDGGDGRWITVIYDSAHSLGADRTWHSPSTFSFHPVKSITTAEGGAVVMDNDEWATAIRQMRNHGRDENGLMVRLGFNYRMSDMQAALGISQLKRIDKFIAKRRALSCAYRDLIKGLNVPVELPAIDYERSACHLFPVLVPRSRNVDLRNDVVKQMRDRGIGVGIHYWPIVPLHPFYVEKYHHRAEDFPVAFDISARIMSLPLHVGLTMQDVEKVVDTLKVVLER